MEDTFTAATTWELKQAQSFWPYLGYSDLAHVLNLLENQLIPQEVGESLLKALLVLQDMNPNSVPFSEKWGDLYKNREQLIKERSKEAAQWYGVGRARRELTTVAFHLLIKEKSLALMQARLKFVEVLLEKSHSYKDTPMADYTYLQPAQPSTLGYYLSSFLGPILRNADRAQPCFQRLNLSPAGVGSTNGSTMALNREKLANRLGFEDCVENSRDGVWQSDVALEVAWLLASDSLVLARLSEDFLVWATQEFDYFGFSDEVCRGSVAMPQKKNPYDLTFARGVASLLSGRVSGALCLGRTGTNQIDNRIFLYNELPESLDLVLESYQKLTRVLEGLQVNTQRLKSRGEESSLLAMDLVEELVANKKMSHSQAHSLVGEALRGVGVRDFSKTFSKVFSEKTGQPLNWSAEQWQTVLSSQKSVERRKDRGGASSPSLLKSLSNFKSWSQRLEELSNKQNEDWKNKKKKIVSEAKEALL